MAIKLEYRRLEQLLRPYEFKHYPATSNLSIRIGDHRFEETAKAVAQVKKSFEKLFEKDDEGNHYSVQVKKDIENGHHFVQILGYDEIGREFVNRLHDAMKS